MRTKYTRIAAVVMAITAGGLAAFALRPAAGSGTATLAARNPAVEVRTQVIRRTIHVIRHEPGATLRGSRGSSAVLVAGHGRARTAASGKHGSAHGTGTASAAVATRASGAHTVGSSPSSASGVPVATRSSGSHSSGSSSAVGGQGHPVATRSSGSHGTASSRPVTRSSGGGHGEDGGDGGGGDN